MGIDPITLGVLGGATLVDLFTEEELPEAPAVKPLDLETEGVDVQIGVNEFEGLSTEQARAKRSLRTDILQFNNTIQTENDFLTIGDEDV